MASDRTSWYDSFQAKGSLVAKLGQLFFHGSWTTSFHLGPERSSITGASSLMRIIPATNPPTCAHQATLVEPGVDKAMVPWKNCINSQRAKNTNAGNSTTGQKK